MRVVDLTDVSSETRILVTGGAGFIGTWLTRRLLADGYAVDVLDNMSAGSSSSVDELNENPAYTFYQGSVLDEVVVDRLAYKNDVIVHLAGAVGVRKIMEEPLTSFRTNILGATTVLEAAHRYQRKIFLASTSEIYGKNPAATLSETSDRVLGPPSVTRWAYSTAKAVAEIMALSYHRERDLPIVVGRFFNTVGPGQIGGNGMVIPRFVDQAIAGVPLTVHGDGQQVRCFCHVDDTVEAIVGLLFDPRAIGHTFNIGTTEQVTIMELAELVVKLAESSSEIALVPYFEAFGNGFEDLPHRIPDVRKLRSLLRWRPQHDLKGILGDVITHQRLLLEPSEVVSRA